MRGGKAFCLYDMSLKIVENNMETEIFEDIPKM